MEFPKQNIHYELSETNEKEYSYYFFTLVFFIILGYIFYLYFYTENLLEKIERKLNDLKETIAFYTNQMLLKMNMDGYAIKTTQVSSFSKMSEFI